MEKSFKKNDMILLLKNKKNQKNSNKKLN